MGGYCKDFVVKMNHMVGIKLELQDLASYYVNRIRKSHNKKSVTSDIINEIFTMQSSEISLQTQYQAKIWLLEQILGELNSSTYHTVYFEKSADNKHYLQLISDALSVLKNTNREKEK